MNDAQRNFASMPRPVDFIRVRIQRNGNAEWLRDLLLDEKADLFEELGRLRGEGLQEEDPEVTQVTTDLRHCIWVLRDIETGLIELIGPDTVLRR